MNQQKLNEQLDQMKKSLNLSEGYREAKDLERLAGDILWFMAKQNIKMIHRILRRGMEAMEFDQMNFEVRECHLNWDKYANIRDFIVRSRLQVRLTRDIPVRGRYANAKPPFIELKYNTPGFMDELESTIMKLEARSDGATDDAIYIALGSDMSRCFRSTLMHELQHAFDDWVSGGNYNSDNKSKKYYDRRQERNADNSGEKMSKDERNIYLTLPHEYWARFTQAASQAGYLPTDWEELLGDFKEALGGWKLLSPNHQKRLIKAFYKYCTLHNIVKTNSW